MQRHLGRCPPWLTPARAHSIRRGTYGLAAALPEEAEVHVLPGRGRPQKDLALARPTGVGRALATYVLPIEGRDEWLAAARRLA